MSAPGGPWVQALATRVRQALRRVDGDAALLAAAALALAWSACSPTLPGEQARPLLVVTLDITQSMNVPDAQDASEPGAPAQPRLAFARQALHQALQALPCGSRLGWAVFTEYRSYLLLAPLEVCAHLPELQATLAGIDNRMAWTGNSEVAKGLHSAWTISQQLPEHPALVFVTDGQEAPPLHPRYRPHFDDKPGEVAGLVLGVGGPALQPIPKTDPRGRTLGPWAPGDVLQTDPRTRSDAADPNTAPPPKDLAGLALVGATPGAEHLSALREAYLQRLAGENGLAYQRLDSAERLARALQAPALSRPVPGRLPLAPALQGLALALLLARYRSAWWRVWTGAGPGLGGGLRRLFGRGA
jgi:mxaL protein